MSAAAQTQPDTQPSRSGRLLTLVRRLIDYATELATTVRQRVTADPFFAGTCFGTADLAVIFARITHGLLLAEALEARLLRRAAVLDKGPRPRLARSTPRPTSPASPPAQASDPHLADLPTAEQIAAEVRRRPIGAVVADIYRNLGILPSHPLWRDVQRAMHEFRGNVVRLLRDILDRALPINPQCRQPATRTKTRRPALLCEPPSGTGPP